LNSPPNENSPDSYKPSGIFKSLSVVLPFTDQVQMRRMSTTGHATPTDNMNFLHGKGRLAVFSEISPEDSEDDLSEDEIAELGLHMQKSSLLTSATSRDIMNSPPMSAVLDEEIKFEDCKASQQV